MSNTNTCGTCRFFSALRNENDEHDIDGGKVPAGYALCGRIGHNNRYKDAMSIEPQGARACVVDGSGYYAALCVTTDFGCTEWTPK